MLKSSELVLWLVKNKRHVQYKLYKKHAEHQTAPLLTSRSNCSTYNSVPCTIAYHGVPFISHPQASDASIKANLGIESRHIRYPQAMHLCQQTYKREQVFMEVADMHATNLWRQGRFVEAGAPPPPLPTGHTGHWA